MSESNWLDSMTGKPSGSVEIGITGRKEAQDSPKTFTEAVGDAIPTGRLISLGEIEDLRKFCVRASIDVLGMPNADIKQTIYGAKRIEQYLLTGEFEEDKVVEKAAKARPKEE